MSAVVVRGARVTFDRPWASMPVADFAGLQARIYWTDAAYPWHANDGAELFVVLDGEVEMHWRDATGEHRSLLRPGDTWTGGDGVVHRAMPHGQARVLVVEQAGGDTLVDGA